MQRSPYKCPRLGLRIKGPRCGPKMWSTRWIIPDHLDLYEGLMCGPLEDLYFEEGS